MKKLLCLILALLLLTGCAGDTGGSFVPQAVKSSARTHSSHTTIMERHIIRPLTLKVL